MARPERNTVDYFPHLIGEGKKIFTIENKYGNDGYATWFKILEKLATTEYHFLNLNDEGEVMYLAAKCRVSEQSLFSIITDLSRLDVFNKLLWESRVVWCQTFIDHIQDAYFRRNNKCFQLDGLCKHLSSLGIQLDSKSLKSSLNNPQTKVKESKVNKIRDYIHSDWAALFSAWLKYKSERKEIYKSELSIESAYNKLYKLSDGDLEKAKLIIENSMANNYAGMFELKQSYGRIEQTKTNPNITQLEDNHW